MTDTVRSVQVVELIDSWRALALHGGACRACSPGVGKLCTGAGDPRRDDAKAEAAMCEDGQLLFARWWDGKQAWLSWTEDRRRHQFLTDPQLFDDGASFKVRAEAIMGMPDQDFKAWLELPDDRRHAQLRSLEAALSHPPRAARTCAYPPCQEPASAGYDYCSSAHQAAHRKAQRRGRPALALINTEE